MILLESGDIINFRNCKIRELLLDLLTQAVVGKSYFFLKKKSDGLLLDSNNNAGFNLASWLGGWK